MAGVAVFACVRTVAEGAAQCVVSARLTTAWQDDPAIFVDVWVDQDVVEEDLVELFLEVVGGGVVEPGGIFEQVEGLAEVLAYEGGIGLVAG